MITEEQKEQRKKGIGGSDAAAILGVSPWATALDVYASKTGAEQPYVEPEQQVRMDLGNAMESAILQRWAKLEGKKIVESPPTAIHPDLPWMLGNCDALVVGADEGVEAKLLTSGAQAARLGDDGSDEGLAEHVVQCHHYMAVFNRSKWHLVYFDPKSGLRRFLVKRDEQLEKMLIDREGAFWKMVQDRTPPLSVVGPDDHEALKRIFNRDNAQLMTATPYQVDLAVRLKQAKVAAQVAEEEAKALQSSLAASIGPFSGFEWEGGKVTYKNNKSGPPNWKHIALNLGATPEVVKKFTPNIGPRIMRISLKNEEE